MLALSARRQRPHRRKPRLLPPWAGPRILGLLLDRATRQQTKIPVEIYEEVLAGAEDDITRWLRENRDTLLLDEDVDEGLVAVVTEMDYAPDLSDEEVERVGRDPFLIAHALGDPAQRTVVTTEHSTPKKRRANRHIPDVCDDLAARGESRGSGLAAARLSFVH